MTTTADADKTPACSSTSARMASPSSLLVFDNVRARTESLEALKRTLATDGDVGYAPTQELVVTRALDALVLTTNHSAEAAVARRRGAAVSRVAQAVGDRRGAGGRLARAVASRARVECAAACA